MVELLVIVLMVSSIIGFFIFQRKKYLAIGIPKAAHNRAIKWYQSLQNLPPDEYALELEKWREFVKDLPTNNDFK